MNNNTIHRLISSERIAIVACDVCKDSISAYAELGTESIEVVFSNKTRIIKESLKKSEHRARKAGYGKFTVVCEPAGVYHRPLFRIARQLGAGTRQVSTEAVARMRIIGTDDSGKPDTKDPRVIHTLARIGKTQKHRVSDGNYELLRERNQVYDDTDVAVVRAKCAIHPVLKNLFPDCDFKKDFLYSRSGKTLVENFGCNPYGIISMGKSAFAKGMREGAPRIRKTTVERLYEQAKSAVLNRLSPEYIGFPEKRLLQLWDDIRYYQERKKEIRNVMKSLYADLRREDPKLPAETKGVVSVFRLSRIIGETGPLSDFSDWRKLFRYAGLNIRERQSGQYRGKNRISKKGRPLLRKVLSHAVLPLVKKSALYGEYYHRKKEEEKVCGTRLMTNVSGKFPKMLFGWYKSGKKFNENRIFSCESEFAKAA